MTTIRGGRNGGGQPTVAVVGLGYWGPNLVRVLVEHGDVAVRWIRDLDGSRVSQSGRTEVCLDLSELVPEKA